MAEPIEFFFEFASPYGWFASTRIDGIAAAHGREVRWRPIMLGPLMKQTGAEPLFRIPLKSDYARIDVPRFARLLGLEVELPPVLPMNSLAASRAFWWLVADDAATARRFAAAALKAHWGEGQDLSAPEAVADVAQGLGIDKAALLEAIQRPEIKQRLKDETEAAAALGVFGSPFVLVDGEPFWGADRLDQVERWLRTGGW